MRPARQRPPGRRHGSLRRTPHPNQLAVVDAYVGCGLSASTQRGYASDLAHFKAWGGKVPCSARTVARYVADFAGSLKVSTLLRHLAAIARGHMVGGFESPTGAPLVRATLRGIRRVHGTAQKQAKPITVAMLRKLVRPVPTYSALRNLRDRALLLVGFAGGFRRSELAALSTGSVTVTRRGAVLHLRAGKTDPHGVGRHIAVPFGTPPLCPVRALKEWIKATSHLGSCPAQGGAPSPPLFRRIDRYGNPGGGLCDAAVGWILTQRMQAMGLCTQGFSAHSLRAGLVTSAAKAGVPTWAIQRQTGHKSEHMVRRYIRGLGLFEQNALKSVL